MDESFIGMSGGQIVHEMLLRHNVKHVFGYPGGAILPVFDAIFNSPNFEFILPRHEQGAGHMAEGYARASGKPGVVIVTSGPGATNIVTPMQDALMDGTPLVVFSGQVPTSAIGTDAFQEADVIGITRPCSKWNVLVKDVAELPRRINEAFEIATSGRPGPVLVDLPKDVTAGILRRAIPTSSSIPKPPTNQTSIGTIGRANQANLQATIGRVARLINMVKKPILYVGQGILAKEEGPVLLRELADKCQIPVTTTLQALGAYDELDSKALYMLGMHGSAFANLAMQDADLILALGARFDDRVTGNLSKFAPMAKLAAKEGRGGIVHFDIMPKNINKVVQADEAVEGDVTDNLATLLPLLDTVTETDRKVWFDQINDWKHRIPFAYDAAESHEVPKPQTVVEELSNQTAHCKEKVIICTGVGQHQMTAAQYFRWRTPRTMITSGGLGTMGYGVPAVIGAKVAKPDHICVDIDGDASFSMTAMEMQTASQYNIGAKWLILNNEEQGMVTQWQTLFYNKRYAHTEQKNPDFVKLAESMGVKGIKCSTVSELPAKMAEFLAHDGPVLLEAMVTPKEHCYPMVPAGAGLQDMTLFKSKKEVQNQTAA
ncbi:Thiamin diphosphate-binding protein [Protomyces lactucae-debilis]|uniref:Acetolactate synthase n=1 Tax=Protomyces lactucae-debilis TaxID=2754530 RepID=A0A1Y2FVF2_PROLT|nr:thiamine diphosphate-binding protein [Protomyces lactucae-debilis]ORY87981.1 Thiamin diphosphate-binding protein [Protomyces lactucae-debilis]